MSLIDLSQKVTSSRFFVFKILLRYLLLKIHSHRKYICSAFKTIFPETFFVSFLFSNIGTFFVFTGAGASIGSYPNAHLVALWHFRALISFLRVVAQSSHLLIQNKIGCFAALHPYRIPRESIGHHGTSARTVSEIECKTLYAQHSSSTLRRISRIVS